MTQLDQVTSQLKLSYFLQSKPRLGNALREYKQTITLNAIQKEVIVGTLLGDASIPLHRGKPRLCVQFGQTIARAGYIHHLYDLFYNPVGRLCKHTSESLASSWGWCSGPAMYSISNFWPFRI